MMKVLHSSMFLNGLVAQYTTTGAKTPLATDKNTENQQTYLQEDYLTRLQQGTQLQQGASTTNIRAPPGHQFRCTLPRKAWRRATLSHNAAFCY